MPTSHWLRMMPTPGHVWRYIYVLYIIHIIYLYYILYIKYSRFAHLALAAYDADAGPRLALAAQDELAQVLRRRVRDDARVAAAVSKNYSYYYYDYY